jgi:hydroxyethylthiazole kinase-like uncharacterized protein yjeF
MTEILTAAQMRAIEAAAIASGEVTGLDLMERAGRGVVEAIFAEWPEMQARAGRAVVLCGPGNNGGDGFVVARLLKSWGWEVAAMALGPTLTPDAQAARAAWTGAVVGPEALDWPDFKCADLVVDAMFGTGLGRDIAPGVWGLLEMAQTCGCKLVAVDILSGICADSGRVRAESGYVERGADLTVTFERAKLGHYLAECAGMAGRLVVVPIGLQRQMQDLLRGDAAAVVDLCAVSAVDLRKVGGHKFSHGHAVVVGGPPGHGGAARLAARGALRIGAGLVTLAAPPEAMAENAARLDAVMLRSVDGAGLAEVLADVRITAVCIGPGLGLDAHRAGFVAAVLGGSRGEPRPTVLDADALTLLSRDPALFGALHGACVLTPHGGEFARLFPDIAARLEAPAVSGAAYSKVDACREAAARAGCVVLFKGADTVIAAPDGRCAIHAAAYERSAPWLATAGSGDVLAGFITGLLARGFRPFEAACAGAWLHVECARSFGPGMIAEDLPDELPKVFRALGV